MEKQIEELTNELHKKCIGKEAGVVIGAAFNIAQTAMNAIPDPCAGCCVCDPAEPGMMQSTPC